MKHSTELSRRRLLSGVAGAFTLLGLGSLPAPIEARRSDELELHWLPAWRLAELVKRRELSSVDLTKHFLNRIEALDGEIGAFHTVDTDRAVYAAQFADKAVIRGERLGLLHGVPVSLKQMVSVAGLSLESGEIATQDGIVASRIRAAGGIILGTTTLAGPAAMLGEAREGAANPWLPSRVAGASSSGSAASVAAGFCPISIGSDGGGSTRLPSAWCGVIGMHPTVGRVPADQNLLRSQSRTSWSASYGPITRDARDAAIMLSVIAGPNWAHIPSFNGAPPNYLEGLDNGISGLSFGWTRDFGNAAEYFASEDERVISEGRAFANKLEDLGATVDDTEVSLGDWYPIFTRIAAQLTAGSIYPLLSGTARTWSQLRGKEAAPQWRGEIGNALRERQQMAEKLLATLGNFDILMSATSPRIAPLREDYATWLQSESYAPEYTCLTGHMNLLGFPAITVPAGFVDGMPVGLQLIAKPDQDALLLRAALAITTAFPISRRPGLSPNNHV